MVLFGRAPDVDDPTLQAMKQKCILLAFEARVARDAYELALQGYWQQWLRQQLGSGNPRRVDPIYARLFLPNGPEDVQLIDLIVFRFEPQLIYRRKLKSGRWGKAEYYVDIPCKLYKSTTYAVP